MSAASFELRNLLAVGSGAGVEIGPENLTVTVARVRPSGVRLLGAATIAGFRNRAAAEWGNAYAAFLKKAAASHLAATVLLPREDVIVRVLPMPGVTDNDIPSAIEFQIDTLHPYAENEAVHSWARLGDGGAVLVAIVKKETLDRYITLFAEAGVKVASFTFSGAVYYSALRLLNRPPEKGFIALAADGETYGESGAKPMFSAVVDGPAERAAALAAAELRLEPGTAAVDAASLLARPKGAPETFDFSRNALPYAAALAGACPRLALPLNLLPAEYRTSHSRLAYIPAAVLGVTLVASVTARTMITPIEDRKYIKALEREIHRVEPLAAQAAVLDKAIESTRARTKLLDEFRRRGPRDIHVIGELTKMLEPPSHLQSLELTRTNVTMTGNAEQAAPLLQQLDNSKLFEGSKFSGPVSRVGKFEAFRVQAGRVAGTR